ncbi:hypothetical protein B296_00033812 [Ensete ventricosum]|uniref:Thaumatin-like protein n=1 Tax=Ensete ventricosum TaxID=4639 RepID=A0A426ZLZ3_ENSVE|nr:hypothetical protein B296_00033812 [Ensete ventricosum]
MVVEAAGREGCAASGCAADLNRLCPAELKVGHGDSAACRSACGAFGRPEFCCSGEFGSPDRCRPSAYSQMFKSACPRSYSYAFDDATSTFTCAGAQGYSITFCPESSPRYSTVSSSLLLLVASLRRETHLLTSLVAEYFFLASFVSSHVTHARLAVKKPP